MKNSIQTFILVGLVAFVLAFSAGNLLADSLIDSTSMANDSITGMAEKGTLTDSTGIVSAGTAERVDGESVYPMSEERKAKLISYSRFNNIWRFASFFISLGLLSLLFFTKISARLRDLAAGVKIKFFSIWLYFILFMVIYSLIDLPFSIYRGYMVEMDFGFLNQTFGGWFWDEIKGLLILLVIGIIPMFFFYFLVERFKRWWLIFSVGSIPFLVFFIVIAPVFISPMFNDFIPLENQELKTEILTLADKAGIEGSDVFQVDASKQSSKINAYVTGLFNTKRIVLYDTMIDNFEDDEILFVMGHEMGHYVMNHIWYGLTLSIVLICFMLWLADKTLPWLIRKTTRLSGVKNLADVASFPLVLIFVTVVSFVSQPLSNGYSRYMEHQSDVYGMEITDVSGESAALAFDKLSSFNLSDPDPNPLIEFWFYSHPALTKRMAFVRNFERTE